MFCLFCKGDLLTIQSNGVVVEDGAAGLIDHAQLGLISTKVNMVLLAIVHG